MRPLFLSLVETHVLQLPTVALRPALKAIILALLPGVEDETSEDFERTLRILDGFKRVFANAGASSPRSAGQNGEQYFWQCLFLASITSPSRRMGVLAYLNRFLPRLGTKPGGQALDTASREAGSHSYALDVVTSPEPGLLIRCFATGLADENALIQRSFLDLLVTHLPIHAEVLQGRVSGDDLGMLVSAAAGVVLRRDMGLNRRLWTWFLGPESLPETNGDGQRSSEPMSAGDETTVDGKLVTTQHKYFMRYGLEPLTESIKKMVLTSSTAASDKARPFRISLSLMDRWEVGGLVVPKVFLPLMRSVNEFASEADSAEKFNEVLRSANVFFDGVESSLIWSEILSLLQLGPERAHILTNLDLADFLLSNFNVREEEMLNVHVPMVTLALMVQLSSVDENEGLEFSAGQEIEQKMMTTLGRLVDMYPGYAGIPNFRATTSGTESGERADRESILLKVREFYTQSQNTLDALPLPFSATALRDLILDSGCQLVERYFRAADSGSALRQSANILVSLLHKTSATNSALRPELKQCLMARMISKSADAANNLPFPMLSATTTLVTALYSTQPAGCGLSSDELRNFTSALVKHIWFYLSPSDPRFHVEAVRCIWQLHSASWQHRSVEAAVASIMLQGQTSTAFHATSSPHFQNFTVLWSHCNMLAPMYTESPNNPLAGEVGSGKSEQYMSANPATLYSSLLERPMFLALDLLDEQNSEGREAAHEWFKDLSSLDRYVHIGLHH